MYKLLLLDIDGTLVPYDYEALPSDRVCRAVALAREKVTVCVVTGRSYGTALPILNRLGLTSGYMVANNGAQVIHLDTKELLVDIPIETKDAEWVRDVLFDRQLSFYLKQDTFTSNFQSGYFAPDQAITTPYMFYIDEKYSASVIEDLMATLSVSPRLTVHKSNHKSPDTFGLTVAHVNATKLHGVVAVLSQLGLTREHAIGVGDSYNDFPLLMASGLKIAMGNAVPELKQVAHFVAPSVAEDGVATVIEKFILHPPTA